MPFETSKRKDYGEAAEKLLNGGGESETSKRRILKGCLTTKLLNGEMKGMTTMKLLNEK